MLLLSTIFISFFYIFYIAKNLWFRISLATPSWGDSKSLIYILLISYIILNMYLFIPLNSKFNDLYLYVFTILSIGYIYTLYELTLDESVVFIILLTLYQFYLFVLYKETRKINILILTLSIYLSIWTYKIKDNHK